MTLLVVLGFVVIATIFVALYLSLKSARRRDRELVPDLDDAPAGGRQARGGSRSGRPPSRADRSRALSGSGSAAGRPGRRAAHDADDSREAPDYPIARRRARDDSGRPDRSGLVTAAARRGPTGARAGTGGDPGRGPAAQFPDDDTDPAFRPGYGRDHVQGYDGYDAAMDTRVSGAVPSAGPYDAGQAPYRGYAGGASGAGIPGGYDGTGRGERGAAASGDRYNGYNTGPGVQRPDPSPRGGYPGAPRGRYPDAAAGDVTVANHAYGRADPGPVAEQAGLGIPEPGFGAATPGPAGTDSSGTDSYGGTRAAPADGPFSPTPGPRFLPSSAGDDDGGDGDDGLPKRRRAGKLHKPRRRQARGRLEEDDDAPWPGADVDGVSDEQYWAELSSDKPLATTARTAQSGDDADQPRSPGGSAADQRPSGPFSAPVQADAPSAARGRRGRRRGDDGRDGTEVPLPDQEPEFGSAAARPGRRRRSEPVQSPRNAEEDPLTSASFSRHAREGSDSRSYRASRDPQRPSPGGRRESPAADTQAMMPTQAFRSPGPAPRGTPAGGTWGAPAGSDLPSSGRRDPYGDGAYRNGTRPAGPYTERTGGYGRPGSDGSRHAAGPDAVRPPAPPDGQRRQRPALPGPARPGPGPAAGDARTNGWPDGGEAGYRPQPNGPENFPGYGGSGGSSTPYQERSRRGTGGYPASRRPNGEESGPRAADAYDDPYGRTGNGRY